MICHTVPGESLLYPHVVIPLRILFVGLKFDAGDPRRGLCYEYLNFPLALSRLPDAEVAVFAFDVEMRRSGRSAMNTMLIRAARDFQPQLIFFVLLNDEIFPDTIIQLSRIPGTLTLNWFCDDHWRFIPFTRRWAPFFDRVVTTDAGSLDRYHACGFQHVIHSQWGFNPSREPAGEPEYAHDITFVGQAHSHRRAFMASLRDAGIPVVCHGRGWEHGHMPDPGRVRFIRESRINLNFTETWMTPGIRPFAKCLVNRRADGTHRPHPSGVIADHLRVLRSKVRRQIKARNFEIPGLGGFLLTEDADSLHEYFIPGEEIGTFTGEADLLEKTRYYLAHDPERERIRQAGHRRAMRDHTYEHRFRSILGECGFLLADHTCTPGPAAMREATGVAVHDVTTATIPALPRVSVIFPTMNEARFIAQCLEGFLGQSYPSDRIEIVIADNSSDGTREILAQYRNRSPEAVIVCDNPGGSIPQGYNMALERARGEVVCCFIGHAVPAFDYIERIVETLRSSGCDLVGGSVMPVPSASTRTARGIAMAMRNPFTLGPNAMTRRRPGRTSSTHWMAVTREWVNRCGAFDTKCVRLEDCDWYERMIGSGATARFEPSITSRYFPRDTYGEQFRIQVLNAWHRLRLFSRTGRGMRVRHLVPPLTFFMGSVLSATLFPWQYGVSAIVAAYAGLVMVSTAWVIAPELSLLFHASTATIVAHAGHLTGMIAGTAAYGLPTLSRLIRSGIQGASRSEVMVGSTRARSVEGTK